MQGFAYDGSIAVIIPFVFNERVGYGTASRIDGDFWLKNL